MAKWQLGDPGVFSLTGCQIGTCYQPQSRAGRAARPRLDTPASLASKKRRTRTEIERSVFQQWRPVEILQEEPEVPAKTGLRSLEDGDDDEEDEEESLERQLDWRREPTEKEASKGNMTVTSSHEISARMRWQVAFAKVREQTASVRRMNHRIALTNKVKEYLMYTNSRGTCAKMMRCLDSYERSNFVEKEEATYKTFTEGLLDEAESWVTKNFEDMQSALEPVVLSEPSRKYDMNELERMMRMNEQENEWLDAQRRKTDDLMDVHVQLMSRSAASLADSVAKVKQVLSSLINEIAEGMHRHNNLVKEHEATEAELFELARKQKQMLTSIEEFEERRREAEDGYARELERLKTEHGKLKRNVETARSALVKDKDQYSQLWKALRDNMRKQMSERLSVMGQAHVQRIRRQRELHERQRDMRQASLEKEIEELRRRLAARQQYLRDAKAKQEVGEVRQEVYEARLLLLELRAKAQEVTEDGQPAAKQEISDLWKTGDLSSVAHKGLLPFLAKQLQIQRQWLLERGQRFGIDARRLLPTGKRVLATPMSLLQLAYSLMQQRELDASEMSREKLTKVFRAELTKQRTEVLSLVVDMQQSQLNVSGLLASDDDVYVALEESLRSLEATRKSQETLVESWTQLANHSDTDSLSFDWVQGELEEKLQDLQKGLTLAETSTRWLQAPAQNTSLVLADVTNREEMRWLTDLTQKLGERCGRLRAGAALVQEARESGRESEGTYSAVGGLLMDLPAVVDEELVSVSQTWTKRVQLNLEKRRRLQGEVASAYRRLSVHQGGQSVESVFEGVDSLKVMLEDPELAETGAQDDMTPAELLSILHATAARVFQHSESYQWALVGLGGLDSMAAEAVDNEQALRAQALAKSAGGVTSQDEMISFSKTNLLDDLVQDQLPEADGQALMGSPDAARHVGPSSPAPSGAGRGPRKGSFAEGYDEEGEEEEEVADDPEVLDPLQVPPQASKQSTSSTSMAPLPSRPVHDAASMQEAQLPAHGSEARRTSRARSPEPRGASDLPQADATASGRGAGARFQEGVEEEEEEEEEADDPHVRPTLQQAPSPLSPRSGHDPGPMPGDASPAADILADEVALSTAPARPQEQPWPSAAATGSTHGQETEQSQAPAAPRLASSPGKAARRVSASEAVRSGLGLGASVDVDASGAAGDEGLWDEGYAEHQEEADDRHMQPSPLQAASLLSWWSVPDEADRLLTPAEALQESSTPTAPAGRSAAAQEEPQVRAARSAAELGKAPHSPEASLASSSAAQLSSDAISRHLREAKTPREPGSDADVEHMLRSELGLETDLASRTPSSPLASMKVRAETSTTSVVDFLRGGVQTKGQKEEVAGESDFAEPALQPPLAIRPPSPPSRASSEAEVAPMLSGELPNPDILHEALPAETTDSLASWVAANISRRLSKAEESPEPGPEVHVHVAETEAPRRLSSVRSAAGVVAPALSPAPGLRPAKKRARRPKAMTKLGRGEDEDEPAATREALVTAEVETVQQEAVPEPGAGATKLKPADQSAAVPGRGQTGEQQAPRAAASLSSPSKVRGPTTVADGESEVEEDDVDPGLYDRPRRIDPRNNAANLMTGRSQNEDDLEKMAIADLAGDAAAAAAYAKSALDNFQPVSESEESGIASPSSASPRSPQRRAERQLTVATPSAAPSVSPLGERLPPEEAQQDRRSDHDAVLLDASATSSRNAWTGKLLQGTLRKQPSGSRFEPDGDLGFGPAPDSTDQVKTASLSLATPGRLPRSATQDFIEDPQNIALSGTSADPDGRLQARRRSSAAAEELEEGEEMTLGRNPPQSEEEQGTQGLEMPSDDWIDAWVRQQEGGLIAPLAEQTLFREDVLDRGHGGRTLSDANASSVQGARQPPQPQLAVYSLTAQGESGHSARAFKGAAKKTKGKSRSPEKKASGSRPQTQFRQLDFSAKEDSKGPRQPHFRPPGASDGRALAEAVEEAPEAEENSDAPDPGDLEASADDAPQAARRPVGSEAAGAAKPEEAEPGEKDNFSVARNTSKTAVGKRFVTTAAGKRGLLHSRSFRLQEGDAPPAPEPSGEAEDAAEEPASPMHPTQRWKLGTLAVQAVVRLRSQLASPTPPPRRDSDVRARRLSKAEPPAPESPVRARRLSKAEPPAPESPVRARRWSKPEPPTLESPVQVRRLSKEEPPPPESEIRPRPSQAEATPPESVSVAPVADPAPKRKAKAAANTGKAEAEPKSVRKEKEEQQQGKRTLCEAPPVPAASVGDAAEKESPEAGMPYGTAAFSSAFLDYDPSLPLTAATIQAVRLLDEPDLSQLRKAEARLLSARTQTTGWLSHDSSRITFFSANESANSTVGFSPYASRTDLLKNASGTTLSYQSSAPKLSVVLKEEEEEVKPSVRGPKPRVRLSRGALEEELIGDIIGGSPEPAEEEAEMVLRFGHVLGMRHPPPLPPSLPGSRRGSVKAPPIKGLQRPGLVLSNLAKPSRQPASARDAREPSGAIRRRPVYG